MSTQILASSSTYQNTISEKNTQVQKQSTPVKNTDPVIKPDTVSNSVKQGKAASSLEISQKGDKGIFPLKPEVAISLVERGLACIPVIGAVIGVGLTIQDTKDAITKTQDPAVSKASAALAWTTVGLDVVGTVAVGTGALAPVGTVAHMAGFLTSYLKNSLI